MSSQSADPTRGKPAANPLDTRIDASTTTDPDTAAHSALLQHWARIAPKGARLRTVIGLLYPNGKAPGTDAPPDGFDDLRDAIETLSPPSAHGRAPDAKKVGNAMRKYLRVVRGGRRLSCAIDRDKIALWSVETLGGQS